MVMAPSVFVPPHEIYVPKKFIDDKSNISCNHGELGLHQARAASKRLIFEILKKRVASIDVENCRPGEEDPFFVADLGEIYRQHIRWEMNLRRVKPFYGTS
jgi:ornithine decarboxylase